MAKGKQNKKTPSKKDDNPTGSIVNGLNSQRTLSLEDAAAWNTERLKDKLAKESAAAMAKAKTATKTSESPKTSPSSNRAKTPSSG
jgi:hypothetical protein